MQFPTWQEWVKRYRSREIQERQRKGDREGVRKFVVQSVSTVSQSRLFYLSRNYLLYCPSPGDQPYFSALSIYNKRDHSSTINRFSLRLGLRSFDVSVFNAMILARYLGTILGATLTLSGIGTISKSFINYSRGVYPLN